MTETTKCTPEQLKAILLDMAERVAAGDSLSGTITYEPHDEDRAFVISGAYRIGNSEGQGGMRVFGYLP